MREEVDSDDQDDDEEVIFTLDKDKVHTSSKDPKPPAVKSYVSLKEIEVNPKDNIFLILGSEGEGVAKSLLREAN